MAPGQHGTTTRPSSSASSAASQAANQLNAQAAQPTTPDGRVIDDGLYTVYSAAAPAMAIDIDGASNADGANARFWDGNDTRGQKFWISWNDDLGAYSIRNFYSGKALDLNAGGTQPGTSVCQWDYNPANPCQHWSIVPVEADPGSFTIVSLQCGLRLDAAGSPAENGVDLNVYSESSSPAQLFRLGNADPLTTGTYSIAPQHYTGVRLDIDGASLVDGANVQLGEESAEATQKFFATRVGDRTYAIQNMNSARYAVAREGNVVSGAEGPRPVGKGSDRALADATAAALDPAHLWRASGWEFGIVLENCATGEIWSVGSGVAPGANVGLVPRGQSAPDVMKRFLFIPATVELSSEERQAMVCTANGDAVLSSFGGYVLDYVTSMQLSGAISNVTRRGYDLGFVMMDITTGRGIAYNCDAAFYSASTLKGPYVASLACKNPSSVDHNLGAMSNTIRESSNDDYARLWSIYGPSTFYTWCQEAGVPTGISGRKYNWLSPRALCKLWLRNYDFFTSGEEKAWISDLYTTPNESIIKPVVRGTSETWTKAGWYPTSDTQATADSGIVWSPSGPYVVTIMSSAPAYFGVLWDTMVAIDAAHSRM